MNRSEMLSKVIDICKDVFENEELKLTEKSCAVDVEEWDSLTHLSIISDLENEFEISFTLDEISNAKNIGELVDAIIRHKED